MDLLSLVIKSLDSPAPSEHRWEKISNLKTFTKKIVTPSLGEDEGSISISSVVSGMPTVFARANMFRNALENVSDGDIAGSSLIQFYKQLISEWRGLITCIALSPEKISIQRIKLSYSDGNPKGSTINLYEPKGSFGNMLFERKPLWSDVDDTNIEPFIDVILYTKTDGKKIVIGGTSPDSLLFTSGSYNLSGEGASFIEEVNTGGTIVGKLSDPLKLKKIDPQNLKKVYSYVVHIKNNLGKILEYYSRTGLVDGSYYANLNGNLENWLTEFDKYINEKNIPQFEDSEIPQINLFQKPFNLVFNYSTNFYGLNGVITNEGTGEGLPFDPKELFLPKGTRIACIDDDGDPNFLANKPLLLLKASLKDDPKEFRHFTLPLTPKAIRVFGRSLSTVLGLKNETSVRSRITAVYDPAAQGENLAVTLSLYSETKKLAEIPMQYKTTMDDIANKDILVWPNFISNKWNRYFIYSEMPHNSPKWRAIPFCSDLNSQSLDILTDKSNPDDFEYLLDNGSTATDYAELKIEHNQKVQSSKYEYEIIESKNPFRGFKMMHDNNLVGYLVVEYGAKPSDPIRVKNDNDQLIDAHLGIDFGSTNSAIAYREGETGEAKGFQFKNRRVSLLNSDHHSVKNNDVIPAGEDEVFYFQNDEIKSNEIKSVLALHDSNRISNPKNESIESITEVAIKGGFPCFEKNLPIEDSTPTTYLLNFGQSSFSIGEATLIHSMKWNKEETSRSLDTAHRKAYLGSLLLQVYSDLFDMNLKPKTLKWSYPSAMGESLKTDYSNIWRSLKDVNPLNTEDELIISQKHGSLSGSGDTNSWTTDSSNPTTGSSDWGSNTQQSSWGNSDSDSGWGSSPSAEPKVDQNTGWDNSSNTNVPNKEIEFKDGPIQFEFNKVDYSASMTESEAVANYIANTRIASTDPGTVTLCFDIGGSTTDILALTKMKVDNSSNDQVAMVKQSSIRFAASNIAQATKFSPNFQSVIKALLDKKGVKVEGLNKGANKYSTSTAPYFFEQIVDRLEPHEFEEFYRKLGVDCKEMVSVNLYITGLIVYYAGQLAKKVKLEIDKSPNRSNQWDMRPTKFEILFTGKGSRIMDWLRAINPSESGNYYMDMFIKGFGGMEEAKKYLGGPPLFMDREKHSEDVKYEVAKGLAASHVNNIFVQNSEINPLELIGEEGFMLIKDDGNHITLNSDSSITAEMMKAIGGKFVHMPKNSEIPCPRFMEFAQSYFVIATKHFGLKCTKEDFFEGFKRMNISDYIRLTPEYKMGLINEKTDKFDFVAPIIILEGMQFFENVILKKIK